MNINFTIRQGIISDLPELKKLFVETIIAICAADYNQQQIDVWISSVENNQRWLELIANQFVLVAQFEKQIVGFITLDHGNYIDLLYVHKDYQRQGIATQLLANIEMEAQRQKQTHLISDVSKTARPFFEKNKFEILKEQVVAVKGVNLINYKMQKTLNKTPKPQNVE